MKKSFYFSGLLAMCFVLLSIGAKAAPVTTPTVTVNPQNTTVCSGSVATFSVVATEGTSTVTITYSWLVSTDGGTTWANVTTTPASTSVLSITPTFSYNGYEYEGVATNSAGADTSTPAVLTVIPNANAGTISGASRICNTSSTTLSESVSGGVWSSSNTAVATVNNSGTVFGVTAGTISVLYTYTNTCGSDQASFTMNVDANPVAQPITGPNATCIGATINMMNANTAGTGTWSASNTDVSVSSTGAVTGVASGFVTIFYQFTNACNTVSSNKAIAVDAPANHGVISGPSSVCAGSSVALSESVSGGNWLSSNSGVANVDNSGGVTGVSQGTAVISYYISNACGTSVATYTVSVTSGASAITGGDSVGVGANISLSDSVSGGTWTSSNTTVAIIDAVTGVATGQTVGTATIMYSVTNGCGTTSSSITLHVGNPPSSGTITGADSVCIGHFITLSDATAGGTWTASNGHATVNGSGVVTGVTSGLDTIYYSVQNGFGASQVRKIIFVNHLPILRIIGPNIIALGGDYFLDGIPAGGTFTASNSHMGVFLSTYNTVLYSGTDSMVTTTVGSFVVVNFGKDTITYSLTNSCGTTDSTFILDLENGSSVGPVTNTSASLNVYPNPNQGEFTINLASSNTDNVIVTVTNIVGEKVNEFTTSTNKPTTIKLDQPAGMYFLSANTADGRYTAKITIAK